MPETITRDIRSLYPELDNVMSQIMNHPQCPRVVFDALADAAEEIINHSNVIPAAVPATISTTDYTKLYLVAALSDITRKTEQRANRRASPLKEICSACGVV